MRGIKVYKMKYSCSKTDITQDRRNPQQPTPGLSFHLSLKNFFKSKKRNKLLIFKL